MDLRKGKRPKQALRVQTMDLRRRKEAQTDVEGPVGGPSKAEIAPKQSLRVQGMDLWSRNSPETGAEGLAGGPSKAGRTAMGTKMGENVALAGQKVRQRRI